MKAFLTIPEVAQALCVSRSTVDRMLDAGVLPYNDMTLPGRSRRKRLVPRHSVNDMTDTLYQVQPIGAHLPDPPQYKPRHTARRR